MKVVDNINRAVEEAARKEKRRGHLGPSQIGSICPRQSWYSFRWARDIQHEGRMLRLFNRGTLEEDRFVDYLRDAGYEVREYSQRLTYDPVLDRYELHDWDSDGGIEDVSADRMHISRALAHGVPLRQYGFQDGKHVAGSGDGRVRGLELGPDWKLLEMKTHNDKSFAELKRKGVKASKHQHFIQMQLYMGYEGLPQAVYMAVNKNDDEIYTELVDFQPEIFGRYKDIAHSIVAANAPPPRISQDPSWFACRFCDFREICHYNADPDLNCRSCSYSCTTDRGWYCNLHRADIPEDFIPKGCDKWRRP